MNSSREEESIAGRWRKARVRPHTTARVRRQSTHFTAENLSKAAFITAPPRTPARTRQTLTRGIHVDLTWSHVTSTWLHWGVLQTGVLCCHCSSWLAQGRDSRHASTARTPPRRYRAHGYPSHFSLDCLRRQYKKHVDNQSHRSILDWFT